MTKVAALQMDARCGDLRYNLNHVGELAESAAKQGAKIIAVPEFFTTSIVLDEKDRVRTCVLPPNNPALDLLKEIADKYKVIIGGSYLEKRDGDVFNCYTLVRPNGKVTRHDKDLPTMIENAFYKGGITDGIHQTSSGRIGTAVCWEQIRTQTVKRLKGKIDFLMTGTHWWGIPTNWSLLTSLLKSTAVSNLAIFHATPSTLSKLLGTANIHASHCGSLTGKNRILPWGVLDIPYKTELLGETQIVDNEGNIVAHMTKEDGSGVLLAEIDLKPKPPSMKLPNRFWIPKLPPMIKLTWSHQNAVSKPIYNWAKKSGKL